MVIKSAERERHQYITVVTPVRLPYLKETVISVDTIWLSHNLKPASIFVLQMIVPSRR